MVKWLGLAGIAALAVWAFGGFDAGTAAAQGTISYSSDIQPIFTTSCAPCHIAAKTAGLSLATYAGVMAGGKDGAVIKPGDPDNSLLVQKIKGTQTIGVRMPYHRDPLPDAKIQQISDWVTQGAKDDSGASAQAAPTAAAPPSAAPATGAGGGSSDAGTPTPWLALLVGCALVVGAGLAGRARRP